MEDVDFVEKSIVAMTNVKLTKIQDYKVGTTNQMIVYNGGFETQE